MALARPPRNHENELPPRLFSHQCLERLSGKSRWAPNRGHRGQHRGARRPYFRVAGERSSLVDTSPTYFPDSLSTHSGELSGCYSARSPFGAVSGRNHKETWTGRIVSLTTPTRSLLSVARSVSLRSLAEKASRVFTASYFLR